MSRRPRPIQHRAELAVFLVFRGLIRSLPHRAARGLGRTLGELVFRLDRGHRRVVDENLRRIYPDWSPSERRRTSRACFRHFGAMVVDIVSIGRFGREELCDLVTVEGWEHLDAAESLGRGVVAITAHLGNWEIAPLPFVLYRSPIHAVARPFNNPFIYAHMEAERRRFGQILVDKSGAARDIFRVVKRQGRVGIVMDQRVRPGQGIVVPFMGHDALATPLPAAVCLRTGAPALPVFARPESNGRYRVIISPPIEPSGDRSAEATAELTTRLLGEIEVRIRELPHEWLWMHRRWRLD